MESVLNPQEVGKGIADFGFLIIAGASYLLYSATLFFFFVRWFVRIINGIIDKQQRVLDEILTMQKQQNNLLETINKKISQAA